MGRSFKPGGFVFRPRALACNPRQFGKSSQGLEPADGVEASSVEFRTANLQHRVANSIRERIVARHASIREFLDRLDPAPPGMSYDRVVRILRGETLMQLADVVAWADHVPEVKAILAELTPVETPGEVD